MQSNMFNKSTCFLVALGLSMIVAAVLALPQEEVEDVTQVGIKSRLKLFNFASFKESFDKHYPTLADELMRCQIFLASACKVFTDWINFRSGKSTSYSSINDMSDWTSKETDQLYNYQGVDDDQAETPSATVAEDRVDLAEVEHEFDEILENRDHEGVLSKIAADIMRPEDLNEILLPEVREPEQASAKLVRNVPSNNPHYEAPELLSQGADDENELEPPLEVDSWRKFAVDWTSSKWRKAIDWMSASIASDDKYQDVGGEDEDDENENEEEDVSEAGDKRKRSGTDREHREHRERSRRRRHERPARDFDAEADVVQKVAKKTPRNKVYVDHRKSGCITGVRRQGRCGSCYIFSAIAMIEYHHCIQTGSLVEFSEQFPVDCGGRRGLKGCGGGQERHVIEFTQEYGLELRSNYPYVKRQEDCPYPEHTEAEKMGYLKTYDLEYDTIELTKLAEHLRKQPVMVGVYTSDVFKRYAGGVDSGEFCEKGRGHAMLLVGRGRENGREYWLFKNSHGIMWGEEGYYKIDRESGAHCLMGKYAWTVTRGFTDTEEGLWVNPIYEAQPVQDRMAKNMESAA